MVLRVGRQLQRAFRRRKLNGWVIIVGLTVGLLTVLTLLLGLRKAVQAFVHDVVVRVLVDVGLISRADNPRDQWPNGSTNLPVFLLSMWKSQEHLQASLHELIKLERNRNDDAGNDT